MNHPSHPDTFHGLPVHTLVPRDTSAADGPAPVLPDAGSVAWRLDCLYDETPFADLWSEFLETVDCARVRALVIGPWWDDTYLPMRPVVETLAAAADGFPALRGLFVADVVSEECEISWLESADITPLLEAFPLLEELAVRGGGDLSDTADVLALRPVRHEALTSLTIESAGLPGPVVRAIGASRLPQLETLELWLGVPDHGGDTTAADCAQLLAGAGLPRLRHLTLANSEVQDAIATAVASAPVVARLSTLDLGMGTLSNTGAEALLTGQPLTHLRELRLDHHYIDDAWQERLKTSLAPHGVRVSLTEDVRWDTEPFDTYRFVAVSE
ncbi:hypothetical protein GCM10010329_42580 [Streptomyces spiroverticillatus]|uniref:Leucine-rich repeat domain-containing protein n=1 Tax=Streptomyces finlayi TaxID=67296 RepID=A0A918WYV5_9ACTN|nr:STM4015 family protein [Streptomyces finlayi]GHA15077.1 hypothetical protein GCM10010329_42580 [Streptomyces spiroverticillatus]GHC96899.1 hypothetical protein GCM10010334_37660 [Streptomyces finlayi]